MMSSTRLKKLQENIEKNQAFFITKESDIYYYTEFNFLVPEEKESYLIVTQDSVYLIYASFCPVTKSQDIIYLTDIYPEKLRFNLRHIIEKENIKKVFIDKSHTSVTEFEILGSLDLSINPIPAQIIEQQRMIKDSSEINLIKEACKISKKSFEIVRNKLKEGMTEIEVEELLEETMSEQGSQKPAFPTIIAFGENGALPHHQPTKKKLDKNTAILIDFGATYQNYRSDMTRSFWFGDDPTDEFRKIEEIVKKAYSLALDVSRNTNVTASQIDLSAREYIKYQGYSDQFIHTTGHGLGLEIHEKPSLNWKNDEKLLNKTVFTIEPGIYLKGKFGFRYENTILLDKDTKEKVLELTL
ncbi:MAG: M24 family metallopeptidase [Candidatus Pacebacteria bacterium]|nr:M24 family metallopeptidase [Candidatus Paceibacterota bacterium]